MASENSPPEISPSGHFAPTVWVRILRYELKNENTLQGPKAECEHLSLSSYLGTEGLGLDVRLPKYSKFCENSEYVWFSNQWPTKKWKELFFWDLTDFGKWAISIQWWILDHSPPYESYIGQWALLRLQYNLANLKDQRSEAKFIMDMIGNRPAMEWGHIQSMILANSSIWPRSLSWGQEVKCNQSMIFRWE